MWLESWRAKDRLKAMSLLTIFTMVCIRWIPSLLQFIAVIVGVQDFVLRKAIRMDPKKCSRPRDASKSGWPCVDVFSGSMKVFSASLGILSTLIVSIILPSSIEYRLLLGVTTITIASIYAWYLIQYDRDKRHLGVFTKLTKRRLIQKLSKKIAHNDLSSLAVLVGGFVISYFAETLV